MTVSIDELGPVDWIVVEFPGAKLTGEIAPLSEQDVTDPAETIGPGSSAAVLVWENLWAAPFGAAVRHAGGQLAASGRIPVQAVLAAVEADAAEGA